MPFYIRVGWLDAGTVDGAIERFLTYENSQHLEIGPWNHSGSQFYDPFLETDAAQISLLIEQDKEVAAFFDRFMKGSGQNWLKNGIQLEKQVQTEKEIRYYTMGEGEWKATQVWPVDGFIQTAFYFYPDGSLKEIRPEEPVGSNRYTVDFTATTGENNRWRTNLGAPPVIYADRSAEDEKLLTYTSAPLENDIEITGNPVMTLNLSSTATDGAFYVYLEAVSPEGK